MKYMRALITICWLLIVGLPMALIFWFGGWVLTLTHILTLAALPWCFCLGEIMGFMSAGVIMLEEMPPSESLP